MIFNGISAAWLNFAGPVLSEIWYGVDERALITAVISVVLTGISMRVTEISIVRYGL